MAKSLYGVAQDSLDAGHPQFQGSQQVFVNWQPRFPEEFKIEAVKQVNETFVRLAGEGRFVNPNRAQCAPVVRT